MEKVVSEGSLVEQSLRASERYQCKGPGAEMYLSSENEYTEKETGSCNPRKEV